MVFCGRLCRGWGSFALVPNATSSWYAVGSQQHDRTSNWRQRAFF